MRWSPMSGVGTRAADCPSRRAVEWGADSATAPLDAPPRRASRWRTSRAARGSTGYRSLSDAARSSPAPKRSCWWSGFALGEARCPHPCPSPTVQERETRLCWSMQAREPGRLRSLCLTHAPGWRAIGVDRSRRALRYAQINRRALGLGSRLLLAQSNWLRGLRNTSVDAVLSNPPYVLPDEWDALPPEAARYEPKGAARARA